jgi:hypothetical protein
MTGHDSLPEAPSIVLVSANTIDIGDPIFNDLKDDYPEFVDWWKTKVVSNGRKCWVAKFPDGKISCFLMYKVESGESMTGLPDSPKMNRLKINTLKVLDQGHKLGELLVWQSIRFAWQEELDEIYVTHFTRTNDYLVPLLKEFGFVLYEVNNRGEEVFVKRFARTKEEWKGKSAIEIAKQYAPQFTDGRCVSKFIIPVQSEFHERLFTDLDRSTRLTEFGGEFLSEGNAVKKAYICRTPTRTIRPGDIGVFYRSQDHQGVQAIGIIEEIHYDQIDAETVLSLTKKRTVYAMHEIQNMIDGGAVTVLLFRYQTHLPKKLTLEMLIDHGILNGAPQSFTRLTDVQFESIKVDGKIDRSLVLD